MTKANYTPEDLYPTEAVDQSNGLQLHEDLDQSLGQPAYEDEVQSLNTVNGFLRLHQVLKLIPYGKSTWWAGVKSGRFPPSIKLGPRTTAWRAQDIHQLITSLETGDISYV